MAADRKVEAIYYRRTKDIGTVKGEWFEGLMKQDNPFRKLLPNVGQVASGLSGLC
jgi:hypothetical protein